MAFHFPGFVSRFLRPFSSASMSYQADSLSAMAFPPTSQRAIVAGGCFWGIEEIYRRQFDGKGLLDCRVGYTGGAVAAPSYHEVCTGRTGHAESLLLQFDPEKLSYREIIEFFFRMHDPTTLNRQGADTGTQYRSAVFATSEEQFKIAESLKEKVGKEWYPGKKIATQVAMATEWYDAEEMHQDYLGKIERDPDNKNRRYECPAHFIRTHLKPLSE